MKYPLSCLRQSMDSYILQQRSQSYEEQCFRSECEPEPDFTSLNLKRKNNNNYASHSLGNQFSFVIKNNFNHWHPYSSSIRDPSSLPHSSNSVAIHLGSIAQYLPHTAPRFDCLSPVAMQLETQNFQMPISIYKNVYRDILHLAHPFDYSSLKA
ncbi:hypothetical protein CEXT_535951 [Caerostris extrusa]|uniref:Uncharacterized protein n=1 Tax=Caerostris extrusa TaxID=172846 RepID=A0AAV4QKM8_CAEEX|nr:hypothetical protein CEXT_535951 [Caerostris extrusa]